MPPRSRHSFLPPEDGRVRFDHHLHYQSQMRPRRPLLSLPPRRPGDWPGHHSPPAVYHGNPRGFPHSRTEERHFNVMSDQSEPLNDPRLHRKSVDSFPHSGGRQLKLLGSPLRHPPKQESLSSADRVTREHSYCQKRDRPAMIESQENDIKRAKLEPVKDSSLPRSFLSPVPKSFNKVSKPPATSQAFISLGAQSISNHHEGTSKVITDIVKMKTLRTVEKFKKLLESSLKSHCKDHWPVPKEYPLDKYDLDLNSDPDSGSDEEMEVKVQDLNVKTLSVDSAKVDVPSVDQLASGLNSNDEVIVIKPMDDQQKNESLNNQSLESTSNPSSCDSSLMSHDKDKVDKVEGDQPSTRRSKRLADIVSTLNVLVEDRHRSPSVEDVPEHPCSTANQLPSPEQESRKEERQLRKLLSKKTVGARSTRRKMRKRLMKPVNKKVSCALLMKFPLGLRVSTEVLVYQGLPSLPLSPHLKRTKPQSSSSVKDTVPNELKRLVSEVRMLTYITAHQLL